MDNMLNTTLGRKRFMKLMVPPPPTGGGRDNGMVSSWLWRIGRWSRMMYKYMSHTHTKDKMWVACNTYVYASYVTIQGDIAYIYKMNMSYAYILYKRGHTPPTRGGE
uniref:Uncharacterized protein n=1 Tax=Torulaspora globosa TaxID=48254 RepID=A0A0H3V246_9SACH|nr:hypothetical protein [Torulaspora globosa]AJG03041.1 hypothetical protein [Torulaspora globosa]